MKTINQVIQELDTITESCYRQRDLLGVFAAVYRRTTQAVLDAIREGRFEDAPRMEQLDVVFALRYIDAYHAFRKKEPASLSWVTAFEAAREQRLVLLQHLLLGMNAHIMLDLGVAAAQVCPGADIYTLEADFMRINDVLDGLIDEIQHGIGRYSPVWRVLDIVGWRLDEKIVSSGIRDARNQAWAHACELALLEGFSFDERVRAIDREVAEDARRIIRLVAPARPLHWLIRKTEKNPLKAIPVLQGKNL
jgi:hypothetical protein